MEKGAGKNVPIIQPFNGVFYHPDQQKNLARLVAPPYDVITADYKQELLARNPYNIVRLILGKSAQEKGKPRPESEYRQAAETLKTWRRENILVHDQKPALYYLEEEFTALGKKYCRKGFIGLLELGGLGNKSVLPHEKTMSGPKEDRLKLMNACRAGFSQIFTLYDDPDLVIEQELQQHRLLPTATIVLKPPSTTGNYAGSRKGTPKVSSLTITSWYIAPTLPAVIWPSCPLTAWYRVIPNWIRKCLLKKWRELFS